MSNEHCLEEDDLDKASRLSNYKLLNNSFSKYTNLLSDYEQVSCSLPSSNSIQSINSSIKPQSINYLFNSSKQSSNLIKSSKMNLTNKSLNFKKQSLSFKLWSLKILFLTIICQHVVNCSSWQETIEPKVIVPQLKDSEVQKFNGNSTYYRLLERHNDYMLVGSKNIIFNISLNSLEENNRLEWYSKEEDVRMCLLKGKSAIQCQNYIRLMATMKNGKFFICGTNSFKPICRHYEMFNNQFKIDIEETGQGIIPYSADHESVSLYAGPVKSEENLYVATVAQFSGADPLIYRLPLRTEQFNPKHLNAPSFVNALHHSGQVFFMFRESAIEEINCGKKITSRIARVCMNDKGGLHKFSNKWTTFLKARLNCSVPGEYPFYFDEIQSTSDIINGYYHIINRTNDNRNQLSKQNDLNSAINLDSFAPYSSMLNMPNNFGQREQLIYGVFTTNENALTGSAICVYSMTEIERVFRESAFKGQYNGDSNGNWLPIPLSKTPSPRPGQCIRNQTDEKSLHFIKENPLLDEAVQPEFGGPILLSSNVNYRYTKITIDPQIEAITLNEIEDKQYYDVMFIGTNDGRVIKAINSGSGSKLNNNSNNNRLNIKKDQPQSLAINNVPVIIEEVHVHHSPITDLRVERVGTESKLIVFSQNEIRAIPLFKCGRRATTCIDCVALQDPYCAWDTVKQQCSGSKSRYWKRELFIQNVKFGLDTRCGNPNTQATIASNNLPINNSNNNNDDSDEIIIQSKTFYTSETFIISLICGILASLVIGFFVGLLSTKHSRYLNKMNVRRPGDDEENNICHYEDIDPRFGNMRHPHQYLTSHLSLGTNSPNSSQINYSQNNNYHQYAGLNTLNQNYNRNNGRPLPSYNNHQINMSNAYGLGNGTLLDNTPNLLINGTNSNKINLMNNKTSTLNKSQLKSNQQLMNSNPYNTLNSMNSKNEKRQQAKENLSLKYLNNNINNNFYLDSAANSASLSATSYESQSNSSSSYHHSKIINLNNHNNSTNKPLIDSTSSSTLRLEMQSQDLGGLSDQSSSCYGVYNVNSTLPSNQRMILNTQEQEYEEISAI